MRSPGTGLIKSWINKAVSEVIGGGMTESQVQAYLEDNNYIKLSDLETFELERDILKYPLVGSTPIYPTGVPISGASYSDLDKPLDNDIATYAHMVHSAVAISATAGGFQFDLGFTPTRAFKLSLILGMKSSATGNPYIYLDQSVDGTYTDYATFRTSLANPVSPSNEKRPSLSINNVWNRYFRILYVNSSSNQSDIEGFLYSSRLLDFPRVIV